MESSPSDRRHEVLLEAAFSPKVPGYLTLYVLGIICMTCVGIFILPIAVPFVIMWSKKYVQSLRCTLTRRALKVSKGVLFQVEKSIPLDKITDLAHVSGPLLRYFEMESIHVETAGQSGQGALVSLVGIMDGREFRDAVLSQRDKVVASSEDQSAPPSTAAPQPAAAAQPTDTTQPILADIRDTLHRIEGHLASRDRE